MTVVSVPGKVILMGEHAAVFGRPALVAALDLRLRVEVKMGDAGVSIELLDVGSRTCLSWQGVRTYARRVRDLWQQFRSDPAATPFEAVRGRDAAHLPTVALGELVDRLRLRPGPVRLRVRSQIPIGAGFGSSAALGVGIVTATARHLEVELERAVAERIALDVERRQHGTPSGVDSATVLRGGLLWATRPTPEEELQVEELEASGGLLEEIRIFSTGEPAESTGEVVAEVGRRMRERRLQAVLERIEASTHELRAQLMGGGDRTAAMAALRDCEKALEELGIVPQAVQQMIRTIESEGGAAKISGAGTLTGDAAGSLLVLHPDPDRIATWPFRSRLRELRAKLGAEGARRESKFERV